MCRKLILSCLLLVLIASAANATQYAYQVTFSDKNGTVPFSDSLSFLSARSMSRRDRQGIVLDSTDLPVTKAYVDSVLTLTGGKLHEVSKWLNLCVILVNDPSQVAALSGVSFISNVQQVGYYSTFLHRNGASSNSTAPLHKTTASGSSYYGYTWNQTLLVNGNYLHDNGYRGYGKLIAVLDAGFIAVDTHPGFDSLRNEGRLVDAHNFTLDTSYVYGWDTHGTSVLSTMAGNIQDSFVGSAPKAMYALYVTEDDLSEQPIELINMLCGAERADSLGADVITSSLGYNLFDNTAYGLSFSQLDGKTTTAAIAANMATRKGMLFIASAGNEGTTSGWNQILTPGDADSALTVGSVQLTGVNAASSGYGPNAAGQIKPDVCALGQFAYVFTETGYAQEDGTSFSTPQIAGWAACLWEAYPDATPARVRHAIIHCADHFNDPGVQIGYGIPNFSCVYLNFNSTDTPVIPADGSDLTVMVPNPLSGILSITVTLRTPQTINFRLVDIAGRQVTSFSSAMGAGKNAALQYNIANLAPGMYFLKAMSASGKEVTLKVVKD